MIVAFMCHSTGATAGSPGVLLAVPRGNAVPASAATARKEAMEMRFMSWLT